MSAHDHPQPPPVPTFSDLLAAAEAARRISTPPPATPRPDVPDEDAA
ncbi:hypothetical protein [Streptomyces sp. NPDC049040]